MELEKPFLDRLRRFLGQNDGKDVPRTDEQLTIAIAIVGYTLGEGGDWEDSDWGIQAGELAGDRPWGGSSGSDDEG